MPALDQTASAAPLIVTDSTCDLPRAVFDQYGIELVPLKIQFGDDSYLSGIDMHLEQFVERLARGDAHPTSSQPTVHEFKEVYQSLAEQDRPILSIHISEGLSGTVNAARQAASQLPDQAITVWDSRTISAAGWAVEQIQAMLARTHEAANLLFTLDDLSFLARGGRIGSVRYHVAQALSIKPMITVSKSDSTAGTYVSAGKIRRMEKAVDAFVDKVIKDVGEGNKLRAMIFHGIQPTEDFANTIKARLQEHFDCVFLETDFSTPVLGVHVGPLALDIGYAGGDWEV